MWNKVKEVASVVFGLFIIAVLAYATFRLFKGGWHSYKSLSDNAQIAIALAIISLASTLGSLYYTKIKDRQLQIEASHTDKKQKLYDEFMKDIIELIADPTKSEDEAFSLEMRKKFMSNSLLWSNPKVLRVYHKFRSDAQSEENSDAQSTIDLASLFLAFRQDLGLSNKNIDEQTLLEIIYDKQTLEAFGISYGQEK